MHELVGKGVCYDVAAFIKNLLGGIDNDIFLNGTTGSGWIKNLTEAPCVVWKDRGTPITLGSVITFKRQAVRAVGPTVFCNCSVRRETGKE
jgi:hypothetical protein